MCLKGPVGQRCSLCKIDLLVTLVVPVGVERADPTKLWRTLVAPNGKLISLNSNGNNQCDKKPDFITQPETTSLADRTFNEGLLLTLWGYFGEIIYSEGKMINEG